MSRSDQEPAIPADPLGETLHLLRLTGTLYCRAELTAPWGIDLPLFEGYMMFHIVTEGRYWLELEGEEPRLLERGSLVLIPHGLGHVIRSDQQVRPDPLFDIPVEEISDCYEIMRHGGGGDLTHMTCGVVRFDHVAADHLIPLLPKVLQIDTWNQDEDSWLQSTLRFITREAKELRPGGETVITRLADILVIQIIRSWIDSAPGEDRGWLSALSDEYVGKALTLMHREPARPWTVESLAREVSMSRSAFSARFTDKVGEPVLRYLTRWRMRLAHTQLRETTDSLTVLAERLGYQSEAAFCRAFKRVFGVSPGSVRVQSRRPEGSRAI
ncbi:MAG: AraC-like DNA-binding protein [Planctomycetota bacterium]|jgi:AraC-like DNA-binding protein